MSEPTCGKPVTSPDGAIEPCAREPGHEKFPGQETCEGMTTLGPKIEKMKAMLGAFERAFVAGLNEDAEENGDG